jgi:hypothetical protein
MPALPDARPARPGRYTYSATVDGVAGPASLVVRDVRAGRFTERLSVGGSVNQRTVRWQAGQTSLLDTYSRSGSCAYDPAPTDLLLPLRSGASWRTRGTCHPTDGSIDMAEQARITGAATVRLEGKDTPVWVIERSTTMTARSAGTTVVSETRRTDLFAPGLGLIVYQAGRSAAPDENGKVRTSTWTLELASASAR